MTEKIDPGDIYRKIQYAENIFKRGMTIAILMLSASVLFYLLLIFSNLQLLANFLLIAGSIFGSIAFTQHYLGYRIIQRIKQQGKITDKDMRDVMKLKWGPF